VRKGYSVALEYRGHRSKLFFVVITQLFPGPINGGGGHGVEHLRGDHSSNGQIVIPSDGYSAYGIEQIETLGRIRAVSNEVAGRPGFVNVEIRLRIRKNRFKRGLVRVNVGEQQNSHWDCLSHVGGIDPSTHSTLLRAGGAQDDSFKDRQALAHTLA
jgi:hypothetical protein